MKFRYIGYGNDPPENIVFFEVPFTLGETKELTGEAAVKALGIKTFALVSGGVELVQESSGIEVTGESSAPKRRGRKPKR